MAQPPRTRPPLNLGAMARTPDQLWTLSQRLVTSFSGLLAKEKPFNLLRGEKGCTDCRTYIQFDPTDPEGYLVVEHELSHVLFESDPVLVDKFADNRAQRLLDRAGIAYRAEGAETFEKLKNVLFTVVNALDDWRCCWLWSEIYPGGGSLLQKRWEMIAEYELEDAAEKQLLIYIMRRLAGVETPNAPALFRECDPDIDWARQSVGAVDFTTCLGFSGMLVDKIGSRLIEHEKKQKQSRQQGGGGAPQAGGAGQPPPPGGGGGGQGPGQKNLPKAKPGFDQAKADARQRAEQLAKLDIGNTPIPGLGQNDRVIGSQGRAVTPSASVQAKLRSLENAAKFGQQGEFAKMIEKGSKEMQQRIEDAKKALNVEVKGESAVKAEKFLAAFRTAGIDKTTMVRPSGQLPPPTGTALQVRRRLEKIRNERRLRHSDDGIDVDFDELLEAMLANELHNEPAVFLDMKQDPGLDLLLLLDVSGSMLGLHLTLLDQAVADLKAAAGASTKLSVWAYDTQVYIFETIGSLQNVQGIRHGGTSSVQALDAAYEWAKNDRSKRAILFATDGYPTSVRGRNSTGDPIKDMRNVIDEIRAAGVPLSVLALGPETTRPMYDRAFGKGMYGLLQTLASMNAALLRAAEILVELHTKKRTR